MHGFKFNFCILFFIVASFFAFSQPKVPNGRAMMDFRNQKITDIIYSLAEIYEKSVSVDETVTGITNYHLEENDFEAALNRLCSDCYLYVDNRNGVYYVSKVRLEISDDGKVSMNVENVGIEILVNMLSRKANTTIMYDALPNAMVTIRVNNVDIDDILNLVLLKLPGFSIEHVASGFYLSKTAGSNNARRNIDIFSISKNEDLFSVVVQRASFMTVVESLFKKAGNECSLLVKNTIQLENLKYENKKFQEVLRLLLEQGVCDYTIGDNGVYYIFDIQRKDILKKLKETKVIVLKSITIDGLTSLLPSELNNASFIRFDKGTNTVVLNGSFEEIYPIESFIKKVDVSIEDVQFERFSFSNITSKEGLAVVPKNFFKSDAIMIPGTNSFVAQVEKEKLEEVRQFIRLIDGKNETRLIHLKYIKGSNLLKSLPPTVSKNNILPTTDESVVFFSGEDTLFKEVCSVLNEIDKPQQQIRYQVLVIQRQKTKGINWSTSFSENSTDKDYDKTHSALLSNVFNLKFDIISNFGVQFATELNVELSDGKSHVLADTTLNGLSGETITFSNTNTFRYRDIIVDTGGDLYTSTTREIASGLTLSINGWASGDGMVTVKVDAQVSKQGTVDSSADTTNPPATSEKKVSTNVRSKSGTPVVIGGLFQQETDITEKRIPILGSIPVLGNLFKSKIVSLADTEFVIYLVPFVEKDVLEISDVAENIGRLYRKYSVRKK